MKKVALSLIASFALLNTTACEFTISNKTSPGEAVVDFPVFSADTADETGDDGWFHQLEIDCALNGIIVFSFQFDPQITWDAYLDHNGTSISCSYESSSRLKCIAPDDPVNGKYPFHFEGHYGSNLYELDVELDPPTSCLYEQDGRTVLPYAYCDGPYLLIHFLYSPPSAVIQESTLDGNGISCQHADGYGLCLLGPGNTSQVAEWGITLDTSEFKISLSLPECPVVQEGQPSKQPADCGCEIVDVECVNEYTISFLAQTCVEDPKPLAPGSITAMDGVSIYTCDLVPSVDGRVYCAGPHPITPGELTIVYFFVDGGVTNQCFLPEWPDRIFGCQIADNPPPAQANCPSFSDESSCELNGCTWNPPTFGALGYCK